MNWKISVLSLSAWAVGLVSCGGPDGRTGEDVPVVEVDFGLKPMADSTAAAVFRNPSYVVLKGVMIGTITQMLDWDDRYVIFDRKQNYVCLFDTTGQFIRQVGQAGKGPREYVHISCVGFDRDNDWLMLYADQPDKIIYYDREGKFVKEEPNRSGIVFNRGITGRNGQVYGVQSAHRGETGHTLFRIDTDGGSTPFLPFEDWPASISRGAYMTAADSGALWISRPFDNRVYRLDPEADGPKTIYAFDFGRGNMPEGYVAGQDDYSVIMRAEEEQKVYHVTKLSRLGRYLFFTAVGSDGWLLDMSTDRVRKLTTVPATGGLQLGIWSYIPLENQHNKAVLYLLPADASEENDPARQLPVVDSLHRENAAYQNPILVIYEVEN